MKATSNSTKTDKRALALALTLAALIVASAAIGWSLAAAQEPPVPEEGETEAFTDTFPPVIQVFWEGANNATRNVGDWINATIKVTDTQQSIWGVVDEGSIYVEFRGTRYWLSDEELDYKRDALGNEVADEYVWSHQVAALPKNKRWDEFTLTVSARDTSPAKNKATWEQDIKVYAPAKTKRSSDTPAAEEPETWKYKGTASSYVGQETYDGLPDREQRIADLACGRAINVYRMTWDEDAGQWYIVFQRSTTGDSPEPLADRVRKLRNHDQLTQAEGNDLMWSAKYENPLYYAQYGKLPDWGEELARWKWHYWDAKTGAYKGSLIAENPAWQGRSYDDFQPALVKLANGRLAE